MSRPSKARGGTDSTLNRAGGSSFTGAPLALSEFQVCNFPHLFFFFFCYSFSYTYTYGNTIETGL
jgi:hypothetical protein